MKITTFYDLPNDIQRAIIKRKQIAEEWDREVAADDEWDKLIGKELYDFANDFEVGKWGCSDRYYIWLKYKHTGRYFKLTIDTGIDIRIIMSGGMNIDKDKVLCRLFTNVWLGILWKHFSVHQIMAEYFEMGLMDEGEEVESCLRDFKILRKVMGLNHFCFMCRLIETIRENVDYENDGPWDVPPYLRSDYWLMSGESDESSEWETASE